MTDRVEINTQLRDAQGNPIASGKVKIALQRKTQPGGTDAEGNPLPMIWETVRNDLAASEMISYNLDERTRIIVEAGSDASSV